MKHALDLPVHFRTGLRAVGIVNGRPVWPVLGGDESEDAAAQAAAKVAADAEAQAAAEAERAKSDDEGKGGKAAVLADLAAERDKRQAAERELAEFRQREADRDKTVEQKAIDDARREGETTANAKANERILRTEVKRLATGKLADVSDAVLNLDLAKFQVDENGDVDETAITAAIADLIARKPHLGATPGENKGVVPAGGADQGVREKTTTRATSLEEGVTRRLASQTA